MPDPIASDPSDTAPLIMTALFDARSFAWLDGLRRRYFPSAINRISAHATLFHHLPGDDLDAIGRHVALLCAGLEPLPFTCEATRFLGRGVAFDVECPPLVTLRKRLAGLWGDVLTAQDRQGYRPHVTIQNKVTAEEARETRRSLDRLLPVSGTVTGLALWHYRGGPWELAGRFAFPEGGGVA